MDDKIKYLLIAAAVLLFLQLVALIYCCVRIASLKRQVASLEESADRTKDPGLRDPSEEQTGVEGEEQKGGTSVFGRAERLLREINERKSVSAFLDRERNPLQEETSVKTASALQKYFGPVGATRVRLEDDVILHFINPYNLKEGIPEPLYSADRHNAFRLFTEESGTDPYRERFLKVQHVVERESGDVPVTVIYMLGPHQFHTWETDATSMCAKLRLMYRAILCGAARNRTFHPDASETAACTLHLPVVLCSLRKNEMGMAAEILSELLLCAPDTGLPDPQLLRDLGILNLEFVLPEPYKSAGFLEHLKHYAAVRNSTITNVTHDKVELDLQPLDRSFHGRIISIIAERKPLSDGCPCTPESEWGGNWEPLAEGLLDDALVLDEVVLEAQERENPVVDK